MRLLPLLLFPLLLCQCKVKPSANSASDNDSPAESAELIKVTFTYGSEKKNWIAAATRAFNEARHQSSAGRTIFVEHIPMGSGECVREVVEATRETHLISPASAAFITLGNAQSQTTSSTDLVKKPENLCLSPVVIAMWEPMAKALGWPEKNLGWRDIHDLALDPRGWAAHGNAHWGKFRFGHTHPDYSNSGLISIIAETYAATGKQRGLTPADVRQKATGDYLQAIEGAVVHYGESTGFFGRKMFANGPSYLSAAVLYENMVLESRKMADLPLPVVAIYPEEGTFWSDHPAAIVNRSWVDTEHEEAARKYLDFLLSAEQQRATMSHGFRPADPNIALSEQFSPANGVTAAGPQTTLEVPEVETINAIRELWRERKKKSHVILTIDTSGSMSEQGKMAAAREGAKALIDMLHESDRVSLMTFSNEANWIARNQLVGEQRDALHGLIDGLFPNGRTTLYDAIRSSFDHFQQHPEDERITAVVVLSDGADMGSQTTLKQLLPAISSDSEQKNTRIFTIAYGRGASTQILNEIAEATKAKSYAGDARNIRQIFLEISTFF
ncbi:MAG: extracellular solute-binding protein [Verrucomicrobiales bacterium]